MPFSGVPSATSAIASAMPRRRSDGSVWRSAGRWRRRSRTGWPPPRVGGQLDAGGPVMLGHVRAYKGGFTPQAACNEARPGGRLPAASAFRRTARATGKTRSEDLSAALAMAVPTRLAASVAGRPDARRRHTPPPQRRTPPAPTTPQTYQPGPSPPLSLPRPRPSGYRTSMKGPRPAESTTSLSQGRGRPPLLAGWAGCGRPSPDARLSKIKRTVIFRKGPCQVAEPLWRRRRTCVEVLRKLPLPLRDSWRGVLQ